MSILTLINPITLSITAGIVLGIGLLIALWKCSEAILSAVKWIKRHIFNWTCFYWTVTIICMAFSAQNAGYIFGLYEGTGLALGIALDLLIIAFTQAMLAAKARGERNRAAKILLFIVFCSLLSTAGNLAHNLHTDIDAATKGVWFAQAIPYLVSTMPLFLIALAWVADLKVNPIASMDVNEYKSNEKKRLDFLQIQIDNREAQAKLEQRMLTVEALEKRNRQLRRGKTPRSFRWFWEAPIDIEKIVANVADNMKVFYEEKINEMARQSEEKQCQLEGHIQELLSQIQQGILQENEDYRVALTEQYDQDISLLQGHINDTLSTLQSDDHANEMAATSTDNIHEKAEENIEIDEETKIVIEHYHIVASWLSGSARSVSLQEIIKGTGHSPQRVHKAAKDGTFKKTRREGYYKVSSVIQWLKTAPLPKDNKPITGEISPVLSDDNQPDNGHTNSHEEAGDSFDDLVEMSV